MGKRKQSPADFVGERIEKDMESWCPRCESPIGQSDGKCTNCNGTIVGEITMYRCPACSRGFLKESEARGCELCNEDM